MDTECFWVQEFGRTLDANVFFQLKRAERWGRSIIKTCQEREGKEVTHHSLPLPCEKGKRNIAGSRNGKVAAGDVESKHNGGVGSQGSA